MISLDFTVLRYSCLEHMNFLMENECVYRMANKSIFYYKIPGIGDDLCNITNDVLSLVMPLFTYYMEISWPMFFKNVRYIFFTNLSRSDTLKGRGVNIYYLVIAT